MINLQTIKWNMIQCQHVINMVGPNSWVRILARMDVNA